MSQSQSQSLKTYILRRLIQMVVIFFVVIFIVFLLIHLAPGDPLVYLAGDYALPPDVKTELTARYGLDQPIYVQMLVFFENILTGNLGESITFRTPVLQLIVERMPATLLLMVSGLSFAVFLGLILGVTSAVKFRTKIDFTISIVSAIGYSLPTFVLGLILIMVFAVWFPVFPMLGMSSTGGVYGLGYYSDVLQHLILPSIAMGTVTLTMITRLTRMRMLEVMQEDYVTTARAKGISEMKVIFKHALKNASLPVVTIIGMEVGYIFAGAVLTETVFSWPGLGQLLATAVFARDYPLIMGMFTIITLMMLISILVTDLIYTVIDPRIRLG
ncbi:MAG: ABC transporter permease [Candidatus Bathyarchaeia archaeon]